MAWLDMVSVVIPSYNSQNTIEECLNALRNQTYKGAFELILVDSSDDRTPEIVREKFKEVIYIHLKQKTDPGTARNIGVKTSKGDIILFIDSDCEAEADWIEKMVNSHRQLNVSAIGGAVCNGNDHGSAIAWASYMAEFREYIPEQPAGQVKHLPTSNISYKKERLLKYMPFHSEYYPQEDLELNHRFSNKGEIIYFDPSIRVYHHHRDRLGPFLSHQKKFGLITARMINLLNLEGAFIVRHKWIAAFFIPLLPLVKWMRTMVVFIKLNPSILVKHPLAIFILALGLIPWAVGFWQGTFNSLEDRN